VNRLREFHEIYNAGALKDRDELVRFGGQKVKGEGHKKTNSQKGTLGILKK